MHGGGKSAPNPRHVFPRSELFALNLGHVSAQGVEICLESEGRFSEVGIVCPKSEARFSEFGMICPSLGHINELPKWFAQRERRSRPVILNSKKKPKVLALSAFFRNFAAKKQRNDETKTNDDDPAGGGLPASRGTAEG